MSKTINEEIDSFSSYARRHSSEVESLDVLYRRWREQCERDEVVAAIEQGEKDAAAGLGQNVADAFSELRRQLGINERSTRSE
jgi:hypothetical protein